MIEAVREAIADVFERRSLDRRTCFAAVRAEGPQARRIVVECSDPGVLDDLRDRLPALVAGGEAEVILEMLPAPGAGLEEVSVASASVVDVRKQPAHAAELATQIIRGDAVSPLKSDGEWMLVRLDDGYIGWVRSWHLEPLERREYEAVDRAMRHRVRENVVAFYEAADERSRPVTDAVAGTPVRVEACGRRGWRRVALADGTCAFGRAKCLERRPRTRGARRGPRDDAARLRASLAETALRFLGIPYVWGGTTPKGFDCSGLTQRVYRLNGILIPRDSDMQARLRPSRRGGDVEALRTGELLFFGRSPREITHVAMSLSQGLVIHSRGQVRVNSLVPSHPLFDADLAGSWRLVCDPTQT